MVIRAVKIHGPNDVRVDKIPRPKVGRRDILLKIGACGICDSDLNFARQGTILGNGKPWPLGHEAAGIIVEVGAEVKNILPGLRVALNPEGNPGNIIGKGGSEGAFADYLLVRDVVLGRHVLAIPDHVTAAHAALVAPFAMAMHAVNQARIAPGEKTVVLGVGPIGLAAIFWLKRRGLENIVAVDRSDPRLGIARRLGAGHTVNPARDDLFQSLKRIHGGGPPAFQQETVGSDVFLDMASGSAVLADIIRLARFRSRIVLAGVHAAPVAVGMQTLLSKEMSLTSAIGHPNELPEAIQMLGEISEAEIAPIISDRFPFGAFGQAFDAANDASGGKVMVLFR